MKHCGLIWAGLRRRPGRTIYTGLSLITAFLLLGILQGINRGTAHLLTTLNNRLYVSSTYNALPIGRLSEVAAIPGVRAVATLSYFGGYYRDKRNSLPVFATNVDKLFEVYPEFKIPKKQLEAMRKLRTGAIVSESLARRYGWKIGDRVPVGTSIWVQKNGSSTYQFDIAGIYQGLKGSDSGLNGAFFINYDYFDEARLFAKGFVLYYIVAITDPSQANAIAQRIDSLFANSGDETLTQPEGQFLRAQLNQIGNVNFIVNSIAAAVLFTLLFLTTNAMIQTARERVPEYAVLKAVGFTDGGVMALVFAEALVLCVSAAAIGLLAANAVFPRIAAELGPITIPWQVGVWALCAAVAVALVSSAIPAWRVRRLTVADALAGR